MPLSKPQLQHVCLQYAGAQQCKYLGVGSSYQHECKKLVATEKQAIDKAVADHMADCKKNGKNPVTAWPSNFLYNNRNGGYYGNQIGLGDGCGCTGYRSLPSVTQGYDVDLDIQKQKKK